MDLQGYRIEQECPECGTIELSAESFEGASWTSGGKLTTRFTCPGCGMHLVAIYEVGAAAVSNLASVAFEAIGASNGGDASAGSPLADERMQTYNPRAVPEPPKEEGDGRRSDNPARTEREDVGSEEGDGKSAERKEEDRGPGLTINYLPMSSNRLMTFDLKLNAAPARQNQPAREGTEPVDYAPTDEDKARLEYFHRQLEGLDTVDEAIDEIDSGYNLSDDADDDGSRR